MIEGIKRGMCMDNIVFGAGKIGREAIRYCQQKGEKVVGVLDNNSSLWGNEIMGIRIYEPAKYIEENPNCHVIIGTAYKRRIEIEKQLQKYGFKNYESFDTNHVYEKERIISYCSLEELEDVILYHVLKDEETIFYIDVGSNDPVNNSVTKWLYDRKNAHGINIEPQRNLWELCCKERPRDINLCIGVGEKEGTETLYLQEGGSTICSENVVLENPDEVQIEIRTVADICEEYVGESNISFMKIDVEGYEKQVLLGTDLKKYRPNIFVIESTVPRTMEPTYSDWEYILTRQGYHYIYSKGVNRYYVSDECGEKFDNRFLQFEEVCTEYSISRVKLEAIVLK